MAISLQEKKKSHIYCLKLKRDVEGLKKGATYIGQHVISGKSYFSSGTIPVNIKKKYGKDVFIKQILSEGSFTKAMLDDLEVHYIRLKNSQKENNPKLGMNLTPGGTIGNKWKSHKYYTDEECQKALDLFKTGEFSKKQVCESSRMSYDFILKLINGEKRPHLNRVGVEHYIDRNSSQDNKVDKYTQEKIISLKEKSNLSNTKLGIIFKLHRKTIAKIVNKKY